MLRRVGGCDALAHDGAVAQAYIQSHRSKVGHPTFFTLDFALEILRDCLLRIMHQPGWVVRQCGPQ